MQKSRAGSAFIARMSLNMQDNGRQAEWRSKTLPAYKRLTVQAERLMAGAYLAGTGV
jgi:hypothetical protein